eukprot:639254-Pyramimonas_sp.AAC.1
MDALVVMPPPERFIIKLWHGAVDAGPPPGANMNLRTGEGADDRKAQLLIQVAAVMRTIRTPLVISA